jgi:hypothetical protein
MDERMHLLDFLLQNVMPVVALCPPLGLCSYRRVPNKRERRSAAALELGGGERRLVKMSLCVLDWHLYVFSCRYEFAYLIP